MKKVLITLALLTITYFVNSQSYGNAIGLRGGVGSGVTYKHNFGSSVMGEAILYARSNVANITVLAEKYEPLEWGAGWFWYYGAGGHIGSYTYKIDERNETNTTIGVDGILGLEYAFMAVPINASLDWKPEFNFFGYNGFYWDGISLSVRYYW